LTPAPPKSAGTTPPRLQSEVLARRRSHEVRSPVDGSVLGVVPITNHVQVLEAVERARGVQRGWVALRGEERFAVLRDLIEVIGDRTDDIVETIRGETGKPEMEALGEILATIELLDFYLEVAPRVLRREWMSTGWLMGKSAYTYREPYGVIGVITSWN
jgi:succinate-semialdehyde dehydrogenase/glutarate-semialdehyde dehydrogenase